MPNHIFDAEKSLRCNAAVTCGVGKTRLQIVDTVQTNACRSVHDEINIEEAAMCIPLSPEVVETLKSLDRIPDSQADIPRSIANELLTHGLAYESRTGGSIHMTSAGRLWLNRCAY
ncbi:hypothetical protein [Burkholderia cepacia]|uniref:hypothetical protein n=1 Tax=Burkholderia cepacia TaxID=292 RepID=UPI002654507A|nr:hypothetical protein [Burkholderia cepacia]MDN7615294.1 hypothetical protein [Burkholderia cepacia]